MTSTAVPQELKSEAARTLIERLMEKTALVRLFRYNAAMKHGVPYHDTDVPARSTETSQDTKASVVIQQAATRPQEPVTRTSDSEPTQAAQTAAEPWWKPWLLPASLLAAGSLATAGGYLATQSGADTHTIEQVQSHDGIWYESPLQYIEDQGGHLP